jgi:hypothetical protein
MHEKRNRRHLGRRPHIIGHSVIVLLILAAVSLGTMLFGLRFRLYSWSTLVTLLAFGMLTYVAGGTARERPADAMARRRPA